MHFHYFLLAVLATLSNSSLTHSLARKDDSFPYTLLKKSCVNSDCSAVRINISNPPINLWNAELIQEFNSYLNSLNTTSTSTNTTTPKIVVISSDIPDFYIAQIDLHLLSTAHPAPPPTNITTALTQYYANLELLTSLPTIFVAEINGRAWGAGDEHAMHMDMRFAGPSAIFSAPEAAIGLIHVGALQWLVETLGPGRTMEYMLSAGQVDATEAARVGWVNRAFETEVELREFVDALVSRIAKFERKGLEAAKMVVKRQKPTKEMFEADQAIFGTLAMDEGVQAKVDKILDLSHDQAKVWELSNSDNIVDYVI